MITTEQCPVPYTVHKSQYRVITDHYLNTIFLALKHSYIGIITYSEIVLKLKI